MSTDYSFLTLLQICDSVFPIGSYTQSNGLETYVQKNIVSNKFEAEHYIKNMLMYNIKYGDALGAALAYKAVSAQDISMLKEIDNTLWASKGAKEIKEGSCKLCMRFLKLVREFSEGSFTKDYMRLINEGLCYGQYGIAFGLYAAESNINPQHALTAFLYNQASAMAVNCTKLIPLGQIDGQKLLFSMHNIIEKLTLEIMQLTIDDLGRCCIGFEIRSMQHEDLYSRLYMS